MQYVTLAPLLSSDAFVHKSRKKEKILLVS
uniref:Uncharacterized protein n=1 Tax=Rhizophora mucronata TaxID=61149 RepID=A0A2P2NVH0_RHIMU